MRKLIPIALLITCSIPGYALAADAGKAPPAKTAAGAKAKPGAKPPAKAAAKPAAKADADKDDDVDDDVKSKKADVEKPEPSTIDPITQSDMRIKLLPYDPADVYTVMTRYGFQSNIVFGPSEEIQTISVGDRSVWQIIPAGNRIFIRPMEDGVTTNMTVLTNRHSYQFDLKSLPASKTFGNIYVAQFTYEDTAQRVSHAAAAPLPASTPAPTPNMTPIPAASPYPTVYPSPIAAHAPAYASGPGITQPINPNYNYTFAGPDELAPLKVFDDGRSTFIKYPHVSQSLPNAYIVDPDGKETLTTAYVRDGYMVVDTVVGDLALKSSVGTIHVYNETLNPK